ncbi:hypothetical protein [Marinicella sp. W31]|uniref:hypothetical protein n=1 Tax=Marinicella sp. W31 TaxID=3023713 RepID=UPI003756F6FD
MKRFLLSILFAGLACLPLQGQEMKKLCYLHGQFYTIVDLSAQCPVHQHSVHRDAVTSSTGKFKIQVSNNMVEFLSITNFSMLVNLDGHEIGIGSTANVDYEVNPECYTSEYHDPYR